ncbi:MAG: alpha/beta fold hydrolase [Verrucomicrobiae bacterium]|nr:alpha/beta fold hydrolase [Verrucomicrobiae bacterium]
MSTSRITRLLACLLSLYSGVPASADEPSLAGSWQGIIKVAGQELPVVFEIEDAGRGQWKGSLLSPSQTDQPIPLTSVTLNDRDVFISVDYIGGYYKGRLNASGRAIRGDWTQGTFTVSLPLDFSEKAFAYERPQTPKEPFPYTSEKVAFANPLGKNQLGGTLTFPTNPINPLPAVILISGSGPQDRDETIAGHKPFAVIADYLTRRGIAVLRYDDRGVGESTGTFEYGTTLDFATDAFAAVDYLKSRREIDPARIGLLGHSEGGIIAPIVATKREDIAFLVLLAGPGLRGDLTLLTQSKAIGQASGLITEFIEMNQQFSKAVFDLLTQPNPDLAAVQALGTKFEAEAKKLADQDADKLADLGPIIGQQLKMIESPWFSNFLTLDPAEYLRKVSCPVLAINGAKDLQVIADIHLPAIEGALKSNPQSSSKNVIRSLPGLNHLFQKATTGLPSEYPQIEETISPPVLTLIGDWIESLR